MLTAGAGFQREHWVCTHLQKSVLKGMILVKTRGSVLWQAPAARDCPHFIHQRFESQGPLLPGKALPALVLD